MSRSRIESRLAAAVGDDEEGDPQDHEGQPDPHPLGVFGKLPQVLPLPGDQSDDDNRDHEAVLEIVLLVPSTLQPVGRRTVARVPETFHHEVENGDDHAAKRRPQPRGQTSLAGVRG